MSNIFSHDTPAFTRQAIDEYFIQPMFMAEDIRGMITVRTDVKGTERLNRIARPSMLTQPKLVPGFNPLGELSLFSTDITVQPLALEFEQNARAFWGSIVEQLLASGYKEDDVEQMKSPDVWNKIILPVIAQAGQDDLIRQMFFADPAAEILNGSYAVGQPDPNYTGYTGFMTHFLNALWNEDISTKQHVPISSSTPAAKRVVYATYSEDTDSSITVVINDIPYTTQFNTNESTTIQNWLNSHKYDIENRAGINGVLVSQDDNSIVISSKYAGGNFDVQANVNGGGTISLNDDNSLVKAGKLAEDEADYTLESMLDVATPEMQEFDLVFMITNSMYRNLAHTFKNRVGALGDKVLQNGLKVPAYEGIPIYVRPDWDKWINIAHQGIQPHRAILTTPKNLLFATDGTSDSEMIESWYNQEAQMRRYRVQYKAQTAFLHPELVVLAGFADADEKKPA